jgi:hypothetical protein
VPAGRWFVPIGACCPPGPRRGADHGSESPWPRDLVLVEHACQPALAGRFCRRFGSPCVCLPIVPWLPGVASRARLSPALHPWRAPGCWVSGNSVRVEPSPVPRWGGPWTEGRTHMPIKLSKAASAFASHPLGGYQVSRERVAALSEPEFTAFLLSHLSMPQRGPQGPLGYDRVLNLLLGGLVAQAGRGRAYRCHQPPLGHRPFTTRPSPPSWPNGPRLGRSGTRSWPVWPLSLQPRTSPSLSCMATGPPPWPTQGRGP